MKARNRFLLQETGYAALTCGALHMGYAYGASQFISIVAVIVAISGIRCAQVGQKPGEEDAPMRRRFNRRQRLLLLTIVSGLFLIALSLTGISAFSYLVLSLLPAFHVAVDFRRTKKRRRRRGRAVVQEEGEVFVVSTTGKGSEHPSV